MIRTLVFALGTLVAVIVWNASVFLAISEGWFKSAVVDSTSSSDFVDAAEKIVASDHPGNFGLVLVEDSKISERYFMSKGVPINESSVFQVASLGKWITAWSVMVLVEEGLVDLDRPVVDYLTRWEPPESPFDESTITVRLLLDKRGRIYCLTTNKCVPIIW